MAKWSNQTRLILANLIGTLLELYDISIYGYFAPVIAANFFPKDNAQVALLNTFAIFFLSYFVRPVGSVLFGHLGDSIGRRKTLMITILIITVSTLGIGLLPTPAYLGAWAPLLLIVFRVFQGMSFSGEFIGSLLFLYESAPKHRKAFVASWATCGGNVGLLLASLACFSVSHFCSHDSLYDWGWRLPFLFAILGGLVSLFFRYYLPEEFIPVKSKRAPLALVFATQKLALMRVLGICFFYMVVCYLIYIWSPTGMTLLAKIPLPIALEINSAALVLQVFLIPVIAMLGDKIGYHKCLTFGIISTVLFVYPYYLFLSSQDLVLIFAAQMLMTFLASFFTSIVPAIIAGLMPHQIRYSGVGFGYNIAGMMLGGTTPMIAVRLLGFENGIIWLSLFFISFAFIALFFTTKSIDSDNNGLDEKENVNVDFAFDHRNYHHYPSSSGRP